MSDKQQHVTLLARTNEVLPSSRRRENYLRDEHLSYKCLLSNITAKNRILFHDVLNAASITTYLLHAGVILTKEGEWDYLRIDLDDLQKDSPKLVQELFLSLMTRIL
ncbi:hypothetical protein J6590_105450 [Homalodisca vitripennis]|nr:hypothetical protein J6590_105450 [Homalodisca vitripennis]